MKLRRDSFNSGRQEEGEKFDDFLTEIKLLSKNCNFCDACYPSLLRDRTVSGIFSDEVREKLLSEKDFMLEKAMKICCSKEKAFEGMNTLKKQNELEKEVNKVELPRSKPTQDQGRKESIRTSMFCL